MAWSFYAILPLLAAATLGLGQRPLPTLSLPGLLHSYDCGIRGMQLRVAPRPGQTIRFKVLGECWQNPGPRPRPCPRPPAQAAAAATRTLAVEARQLVHKSLFGCNLVWRKGGAALEWRLAQAAPRLCALGHLTNLSEPHLQGGKGGLGLAPCAG